MKVTLPSSGRQASGNVTDLKQHLEPWLRGTAEFWASRVETTKGHGGPVDGLYHINHVMPPDEYVDGVDDGILANFGAATILRKAAAAAVAAGRVPGANWTTIADKIYLPFDAAYGEGAVLSFCTIPTSMGILHTKAME